MESGHNREKLIYIQEMIFEQNLNETTQEFFIVRRTEDLNTKLKFFLHLTTIISAREWNMLCMSLQLQKRFQKHSD